jgi:hypothetical protein
MDSAAGHARGIVDAAILAEGIKLERELNVANERIKRLEEELNDNGLVLQKIQHERDGSNERIKRLEEAIEGTIKWIVDLANSGDAGFWNPEEQSVIIVARAALNKEDNL